VAAPPFLRFIRSSDGVSTMHRSVAMSLTLIVMWCLTGCATSSLPVWVSDKPDDSQYFYAVGKGDPTYIETKAKDIAFGMAVSEFAKLKFVSVDVDGQYRSTIGRSTGFENSSHSSSVDIKGAEIIEEYICQGKLIDDFPKGTYFLLVRIDKNLLFNQ